MKMYDNILHSDWLTQLQLADEWTVVHTVQKEERGSAPKLSSYYNQLGHDMWHILVGSISIYQFLLVKCPSSFLDSMPSFIF